mgnify:CR=1 FL=1
MPRTAPSANAPGASPCQAMARHTPSATPAVTTATTADSDNTTPAGIPHPLLTTSATPHAASSSERPTPSAENTPRNTFTAMT